MELPGPQWDENLGNPDPREHRGSFAAHHGERTPPPPDTVAPPPEFHLRWSPNSIFVGPHGIRAGWRLLVFVVLFRLLLMVPLGLLGKQSQFSPRAVIYLELGLFGSVLAASGIMAILERRSLAEYGLPLRGAFGTKFWEGAVWGFAGLTVVLLVLYLSGNFDFGSPAIHGWKIGRYAAAWGLAFLLVGFAEEYLFRGYALFTLSTGIGFWPSAILLCLVFGGVHLGNPGESWIGGFMAALIGLFFCFSLRRTGSLWFAIGAHASWDWAESFLYGVGNSGQVASGRLLNPSFHGSKWMTGGSVGPEGSVVCLIVIPLMFALLNWRFRRARYPKVPNPEPPRSSEPPIA